MDESTETTTTDDKPKPRKIFICRVCGKSFTVTKRGGSRTYCSPEHAAERSQEIRNERNRQKRYYQTSRERKLSAKAKEKGIDLRERECAECGAKYHSPDLRRKYCSTACAYAVILRTHAEWAREKKSKQKQGEPDHDPQGQ